MEKEKIKLDLASAIEYITENRDNALEHLNNEIKIKYSKEYISKCLDTVLKFNDQLRLLEDCLIMLKIAERNEKESKKEISE
jgi:hypothetical protein